MKRNGIAVALSAFIMTIAPAHSAPDSVEMAVTCYGETGSAHTLLVGKCSFTGDPAAQVFNTCKEDDLCKVQAIGRTNGQGMVIVTRVSSVEKVNRANAPLTDDELMMSRACKAHRPCSLTCNRASEAGRDDLIEAGACAE